MRDGRCNTQRVVGALLGSNFSNLLIEFEQPHLGLGVLTEKCVVWDRLEPPMDPCQKYWELGA